MTPPGPRANRILFWMCVLIAINQLGFGAVVPVIALYARSFGVTQSAIGLAIAIYGLARFLIAMPAGQLGDRSGRRAALAVGGLVTASGNLLCAYAPSYPAFVGARFVAGAGAALVLTSGQTRRSVAAHRAGLARGVGSALHGVPRCHWCAGRDGNSNASRGGRSWQRRRR